MCSANKVPNFKYFLTEVRDRSEKEKTKAEILLAPLLALLFPCSGALRVGCNDGGRILLLRLFLRKSEVVGAGRTVGEGRASMQPLNVTGR